MEKAIKIFNWYLCLCPILFLISLLAVFYYGQSINPDVEELNEIPKAYRFVILPWTFLLSCFLIIPFWIIIGVADLLSGLKSNYLDGKYIILFIVNVFIARFALKIFETQVEGGIVAWVFG